MPDTVTEILSDDWDDPTTVNERLSTGGPGPEGQEDTVCERLSGAAEPVEDIEPDEKPKARKTAAKK